MALPIFKKKEEDANKEPETLQDAAKRTPAAGAEQVTYDKDVIVGDPASEGTDVPPTVMQQLASATRAIAAAQASLIEAQETLNSIKTEALSIRQKI